MLYGLEPKVEITSAREKLSFKDITFSTDANFGACLKGVQDGENSTNRMKKKPTGKNAFFIMIIFVIVSLVCLKPLKIIRVFF